MAVYFILVKKQGLGPLTNEDYNFVYEPVTVSFDNALITDTVTETRDYGSIG